MVDRPQHVLDGVDIPVVEGAGYVDFIIPDLPLLTGRYDLTVAVYDETMLHPYDHHERKYQLVVQSRGLRERYGTLTLGGAWRWSNTPAPTHTPERSRR